MNRPSELEIAAIEILSRGAGLLHRESLKTGHDLQWHAAIGNLRNAVDDILVAIGAQPTDPPVFPNAAALG